MFRNAFTEKLKKTTITLETKKHFEAFDMLFIADIHRRKLTSKMFDFPVDIIIIGGDLTEKGVPLMRVADNLAVLAKVAPIYFVWGNNDREVDEKGLRELFDRYDIKVLEDESVELFGYNHLKLAAIDYFGYKRDKVERAFSEVEEKDTVIFVSHTPAIFKYVRTKESVKFLLAGHTHGGQIRLGKLGLYEKGALTEKDGTYELISNGFGTTNLPLRLGAEAEYHLFRVRPEVK